MHYVNEKRKCKNMESGNENSVINKRKQRTSHYSPHNFLLSPFVTISLSFSSSSSNSRLRLSFSFISLQYLAIFLLISSSLFISCFTSLFPLPFLPFSFCFTSPSISSFSLIFSSHVFSSPSFLPHPSLLLFIILC